MTSSSGEQNNMASVSCPCPLCKGKLVSSRKVRNSHIKICCYLPEERGEELDEGDKASDTEESDVVHDVLGEQSDPEIEELEQESYDLQEEDLQQLQVR